MGSDSQTKPHIKYIVFLTLLVVLGVVGLMAGLLLPQPIEFEQTETVASGRYRTWVTDLGVGEGVEYTVTVDEGGPVDVYIAYDSVHPPRDYLLVVRHVGVMSASGTVPPAGREYFIMVDNTDKVGVDPSGPVTVTVSYASTDDEDMRAWYICSITFILFPIIIIVFLVRLNRAREPTRASASRAGYAIQQSQVASAPPIERPKGLAPDRYSVLSEQCQVCGARLVLDSVNNVALCPACGTAGPPRL